MTTPTQAELNTPGPIGASPLTAEQATALNGRCEEIQKLLDSTLENEARAYCLSRRSGRATGPRTRTGDC